jgi:hypothetical protein
VTTKYECPICEAIAANFHPTPERTACGHDGDCPECTCYLAAVLPTDARGVIDFGVNPSREVLAAAGFDDDSFEYRADLNAVVRTVGTGVVNATLTPIVDDEDVN